MRQNGDVGLVKNSRSEKQTEVIEMGRERRGSDVEVALHEEFTTGEGKESALIEESL